MLWEKVVDTGSHDTFRMSVIGGWLVRERGFAAQGTVALQFIPDPEHRWTL